MSIFPLTPLKIIFISEFILVFAMAMGVAPQEFSYLILLLLTISFLKLNKLDALKLFIISIPFFTALPANALSDSMSTWRVLIIVLFLKVGWEKNKFYLDKALIGCHCGEGRSRIVVRDRLRNPEENARNYELKLCETKIGIATALISLAMTKIKSLSCFQFVRLGIRRTGESGGYIRKILNQVQNDSLVQNDKKRQDKINKLFFLTILFFIIVALSLIFAQSPGAGIKKMLFLINIFLLFPVVIFIIKKESDLREILKTVFYFSAIIVFVGYFQFISTFFITLSQFWEFWAGNVIKTFYGQNLSYLLSYSNTWFSYYNVLPPTLRMFSVLPDSHSFAMIVIISTPVVLSILFYYQLSPTLPYQGGSVKQKKYLSILLMSFLLAIFFSGSRGAWVGSIFALMAGLFLFLSSSIRSRNLPQSSAERLQLGEIISEFTKLLKSKVGFDFDMRNNSKYYSKLIAFSVLLFFILMPVSSLILKQNQETQIMKSSASLSSYDQSKFSMFERAFSISDFDETSNKGRIQIWQETMASIKERPFLGVGFGNFNYVLSENASELKKGSSAHSIYFDIASEVGIFGLIVFIFILVEILKTARNLFFKLEKKYLKVFAGSFFVYFAWICAYGLFDVVIFNDKVLMIVVILIGVLYSIKRITSHEL